MTIWLSDSFTEAADTELSLHTPETGGAWSAYGSPYTGVATVSAANGWLAGSARSLYTNAATPAGADYAVEAVARLTGTSTDVVGVCARYTASGSESGYYFLYDGLQWYLRKQVGGVVTELGAYNGLEVVNTDYAITLSVYGSTIEAIINGVTIFLVDDTSIATAGRAGVIVHAQGVLQSVSARDTTVVPTQLTQDSVEVLSSPNPDPLVSQLAVELLILQPVSSLLSQAVVEVMSYTPPYHAPVTYAVAIDEIFTADDLVVLGPARRVAALVEPVWAWETAGTGARQQAAVLEQAAATDISRWANVKPADVIETVVADDTSRSGRRGPCAAVTQTGDCHDNLAEKVTLPKL